jgi:hypothetical protein
VCCLLLVVQVVCWSQHAVLILWTVLCPPSTLNLYYTLIPPLVNMSSPLANAVIIWQYLRQLQKAYRSLFALRFRDSPTRFSSLIFS